MNFKIIICVASGKRSKIQLSKFSFDNQVDDVFYLQNDFYRLNGVWKQRGFGKLGSKEINLNADRKRSWLDKINDINQKSSNEEMMSLLLLIHIHVIQH